MPWFQIFQDGPEYEARKRREKFTPPVVSLKQLRDAVPRHLFERSTTKSLAYLFRHFAIMYIFYHLAAQIDAFTGVDQHMSARSLVQLFFKYVIRPSFWFLYWGWQGIALAGLWCLGEQVTICFKGSIILNFFSPGIRRS